jgi:hypothetical protein
VFLRFIDHSNLSPSAPAAAALAVQRRLGYYLGGIGLILIIVIILLLV